MTVADNREANRFEIVKDGHVAFLAYRRSGDTLVLVHTDVPDALRGQHLGDALVKAGLAAARSERLRLVPACSFVQAYLRKHPDEDPRR
jgi:predicted GNAT family acetyltransferase